MEPAREYDEFRLKSTTAANVTHNVMILPSNAPGFQEFTPPVRLIRDRKYDSDDEDEDEEGEGSAAPKGKGSDAVAAGRGKRKRTRILYLEDEDEIALREQESAPWLLEDFDGQHTFTGKLEGGQNSNYVFFVNQGREFRVLPISRWYRFQPKLVYQPMSLEEAEAAMANKRKFQSAQAKENEERDATRPVKRLDQLMRDQQNAKLTRMANARQARMDDREDIDFEDVFDDDDEGAGEESAADEGRDGNKTKKVTTVLGKQVKKLIKNLDASYDDDEEEDEEELDPYADEDDIPDVGDLIAKPSMQQIQASQSQMASQQALQGSQHRITHQPAKPATAPIGNSPVSAPSSLSSSQPSSQPSTQPKPPTTITEQDVAGILRAAPLRTKDLIAKLKPKLKADPANKEVLRELIKRMAVMRPGATGDDEKLLELRPEFR